jgi:predicted nuclease with TOPRIM domain
MVERKAHKTLHQCEAKFEQEIREYQEKLERTNCENQQLQSELEKLQEEKTNLNDTINTLKQDQSLIISFNVISLSYSL